MSNTELENTKLSDAQPGPKDRRTERRSPRRANPFNQSGHADALAPSHGTPSRSKKQGQAAKGSTKQDLVIQMLGRQTGVSIEDIVAKTKWQPHSVRGFFSGIVRKKLKLPLVSDVGRDGLRRYHIAPIASSKS